jgi:hypothetical protein
MPEAAPPIRLVLFDIDGVLTDGEAQPLDLDLLAGLAGMNRAARADPQRPAVSLCTGRPAPYVEVLCQAIDGHLPAVFENGCGVYEPSGYRFQPHPLTVQNSEFEAACRQLRAELIEPGKVILQPGKEYSLTLFPRAGAAVSDLRPLTEAALGPLVGAVDLTYSNSCLNVLPRGVDKGEGLRRLCELAGLRAEEVLSVGDSEADLPFLTLTGCSAAPANAAPEVKRRVTYASPHATTEGVRDILRHFGMPL